MTGKLQCLQGLRGISITLVILFHLFPRKFVNGFVGVDMFFVLSGYLMARILSKGITAKSVISFFKKRFIRIIPLYYLTILFTTIGVLIFVLKTEREDFLSDIKWSLSLTSNFQPIFEHHSYWQQVSSIRYLTHMWSLAAELQYYLLAPAIHYVASKLEHSSRILAYLVLIASSLYFQLSSPFELSYSFPVSRIWQFLMGSLAFELSTKSNSSYTACPLDESEKTAKTDKPWVSIFPWLFLGTLLLTFVLPDVFTENSTRIIVSLSASIVCYFSGQLENSFFTFPPLIYTGDLSYVIYLVHWPIINFVRYIQQRDHSSLSLSEALTALLIITIVSIAAHYYLEASFFYFHHLEHFFQNKLLTLNFSANLFITLLSLSICFLSLDFLKNTQCLAIHTLSPQLIEGAEFNLNETNILRNIADLGCDVTEKDAELEIEDKENIEYCSHNGTGNGTILVIGNSVAVRAFPTIFNLFNGNYEQIRLFARHGAAPLLNNFPSYNEAALKMAGNMDPDLIWIIQGMNEILFQRKNILKRYTPRKLDQLAQWEISRFQNLTKKVYIDLPFFITDHRPAKLIARSLIYRKDFEEKLTLSFSRVQKQIGTQVKRLKSLKCPNCEYIDIQKAISIKPNKFCLYEPDIYKVLNYDGSHLSTTAYKYIAPFYREKIDSFKNLHS